MIKLYPKKRQLFISVALICNLNGISFLLLSTIPSVSPGIPSPFSLSIVVKYPDYNIVVVCSCLLHYFLYQDTLAAGGVGDRGVGQGGGDRGVGQ